MTYSLDMRERAVSYVRDGGSQAECCRLYKIDPKTLYNWLRRDDLRPCKPVRRKRTLDEAALRADVRDNPDDFLRERAVRFGVTPQAIWYALRRLKVVKKNDTLR